ncbi:MAG: DUF3575 domain-containing protein [Chitinophagaceae bacterium]|nr:DUF3575 domain-containing protein [Chitinophagaceae bacterium]
MQKIILNCLLLICVSSILKAQTFQRDNRNLSSTVRKKKVPENPYKPNIIKLNLSSAIFKTIGVQYEHRLKKKTSIALGLIFRPGSPYPLSKLITDTSNTASSKETKFAFSSSKYKTLMITPEFRYYFKRKTPKGLYLSPFLRYRYDRMKFDYHYFESNISSQQKTGTALYTDQIFGGGILFGYQIVSRKRFAIDFWFLGPWALYSNSKMSSRLNTANLNEFDKAILESNLEQMMETFGWNKGLTWTSNGFETKASGWGLGLRMLGINIGYNF